MKINTKLLASQSNILSSLLDDKAIKKNKKKVEAIEGILNLLAAIYQIYSSTKKK